MTLMHWVKVPNVDFRWKHLNKSVKLLEYTEEVCGLLAISLELVTCRSTIST